MPRSIRSRSLVGSELRLSFGTISGANYRPHHRRTDARSVCASKPEFPEGTAARSGLVSWFEATRRTSTSKATAPQIAKQVCGAVE